MADQHISWAESAHVNRIVAGNAFRPTPALARNEQRGRRKRGRFTTRQKKVFIVVATVIFLVSTITGIAVGINRVRSESTSADGDRQEAQSSSPPSSATKTPCLNMGSVTTQSKTETHFSSRRMGSVGVTTRITATRASGKISSPEPTSPTTTLATSIRTAASTGTRRSDTIRSQHMTVVNPPGDADKSSSQVETKASLQSAPPPPPPRRPRPTEASST
ncbi:hypothetical protein F4808DRAFT_464392 [Astrocystis sublimbata]|nr:hypothetical protein F4808DRAFT_464392 [Astrocystis sublimbata]